MCIFTCMFDCIAGITNISMTMNSLQEEANIPPLERQVVPTSEDSVSVSTASNLSSVPRVASEVNVSTTSITPIVAQGVSRREQNPLNARFGQRPALYPSTSTPRFKQEPVDEEERMDTSCECDISDDYIVSKLQCLVQERLHN